MGRLNHLKMATFRINLRLSGVQTTENRANSLAIAQKLTHSCCQ